VKVTLILVIVLGAWLAYKQSQKLQLKSAAVVAGGGRGKAWTPRPGSSSTKKAGFGSYTQLSKSGNNSPGSGVAATQPALNSTWSIGGTYNIGRIGVTYQ
jgi:hypothetical protein